MAIQQPEEPQTPGSPAPPLVTEVGSELFRAVTVDLINRIHGSGADGDAVDLAAVEAYVLGPLRQLWGPTGRSVAFPSDPALDFIFSLPTAEVIHRHRRGLLLIFCRWAGVPHDPTAGTHQGTAYNHY
eukprot:gene4270-5140_t